MSTGPESIRIPVTTELDPAEIRRIAERISTALKTEAGRILPGLGSQAEAIISGSEITKRGTRSFKVTGTSRFRAPGEDEGDDYVEEGIDVTVTEVTKQVNTAITKKLQSQLQSIKQFTRTLSKLRPEERLTKLESFLRGLRDAGLSDIDNILTSEISRTKEDIRKSIEKSSVKTRKDIRTSYKRMLEAYAARPIEDQIRALEAWMNDPYLGKSYQQETLNRITKLRRRDRSNKFKTEMKRIQTLDPADQLAAIDNMLANAIGTQVNDLKKTRKRVADGIQREARNARKDRNKRIADTLLASGGIGIGLFGAAGFPLLNVGFAAMSGGPVVGAIAGFATAIGEAVRAIQAMRDSSNQAAAGMGFLSRNFQLMQARQQAREAFIGVGARASDVFAEQRKRELGLDNTGLWERITTRWQIFSNAVDVSFNKLSKGDLRNISMYPLIAEAYRQGQGTGEILPQELISARQQMMMLMQGNAQIENDPYTSWIRAQNAILSSDKQLERELQQEMLKKIDEQIKALNVNTAALGGNANPARPRDNN